MSPVVKEKAKEIVGGLHQWMTLLGFPILISIAVKIYNRVDTDHEEQIRLIQTSQQHTKDIKRLTHDVAFTKGQMNYVLSKLHVDVKLPDEIIYQDN